MSSSTKKRRMTEESDDKSSVEDETLLSVDLIKKRDGYEPLVIPCNGDVCIPSCETFLKMPEDINKYKTLAMVLKINTTNKLGEADSDLLKFLYQLYFVISKYQEDSLRILKDVTRALNIRIANSTTSITDDDLITWLNKSSDNKTQSDPFVDVYRIITDVLKRVYTLHFPSTAKFTGLDPPFNCSSLKSVAVRVTFEALIAPFEVQTKKMVTTTGNKKTFIFRKIKGQNFVEELSRYIEHGESCMSDKVWREFDLTIVQETEKDETSEVVVHQQVAPFDITKVENYGIISDILIYKVTGTEQTPKRFNIRSYTKKTVTFNYDTKLVEEYKDFVARETLE